jgi:3-deoxy-manno-octulosonate cytidylyltransferase (CMP-KDO synthetase)
VSFRVVIPARLASTRLPGKVLRSIAGRPMLEHVYRVARDSGAEEVIIATDDVKVAEVATAFGARVCMTSATHGSGTDRINEVAETSGWAPDTVVVNLQGDEPLMPARLVAQAARELIERPGADIATVCTAIESLDEWRDPNVVKTVRDEAGYALYFSRAPIPWDRDSSVRGALALPREACWRHIGLYAYRVGVLSRFSRLPVPALERIEALEQLRALAHGMRIHVGIACERPGPGVDTESDLQQAERLMQARHG